MQLTQKIIGYLHRVFSRDPLSFGAMTIGYDGVLSWEVSDLIMTTSVTGGSGADLEIDLSAYTLAELADFLAAQPGYSVAGLCSIERRTLSARVLLDGSGAGGDVLDAYESLLYVLLEPISAELATLKAQIDEALGQTRIDQAQDAWIEEFGTYFNVQRLLGESDEEYGLRLIAESMRPLGNNVAMEAAISEALQQPTTVVDVSEFGSVTLQHNGAFNYDGTQTHSSSSVLFYGLFDIEVGYNLLGTRDPSEYAAVVDLLVERMRHAGTQRRNLTLVASAIGDSFTRPPTDAVDLNIGLTLDDTNLYPGDSSSLRVVDNGVVIEEGFGLDGSVSTAIYDWWGGFTQYTGIPDGKWYDVIWVEELALFVAVSYKADNYVMTSPDGENWTARSAPAGGWSSVAWSPSLSLLVAVGYSSDFPGNAVMTSTDGISWTLRTAPISGWFDVIWVDDFGGRFVAGGYSPPALPGPNPIVMYSANGIDWTESTTTPATVAVLSYSPSLGVMVACDWSTPSWTSTDGGETWVEGGAVGTGGNGSYSIVWVEPLGLFVAADTSSAASLPTTAMWTSPDGENWTARTTPSMSALNVYWADEIGELLTTGYSGIMRSKNGIDWVDSGIALPPPGTADPPLPADFYDRWTALAWSGSLRKFCVIKETTTLPHYGGISTGVQGEA